MHVFGRGTRRHFDGANIVFIVGLLLAISTFPAAAQAESSDAEQSLSVVADEYSVWDGSRVFVAQGNVTVRYKEAVISADAMRYDAEAEYALFSGRVVLIEDEQELTGASLGYDLRSGRAEFDKLEAVLHADGVEGPMFVRGDSVTTLPGEIQVRHGRLTTCECDEDGRPAYHFAARGLEIYPGDRMVVRGATFYDHGVPLMYLPYFVLSLKEDASRFDMPQVGFSTRTGWYVKLAYNYVLQGGAYGALLLDYYQLLGPGGGVRHTYVDDEVGKGTLLAYGVANEFDGADITLGWNRNWSTGPWRAAADVTYDVSTAAAAVREERLHTLANVEHRNDRGLMSGSVDHRLRTGIDARTESLSVEGDLRQRLGNDWELRMSGDWSDDERQNARRRLLSYTGELRRAVPAYTLIVGVEQRVNPDLKDEDKAGAVRWTHVSRLPDVSLRLRRTAGIDLQFGVARLKEEPSGVGAWRSEAEAGLATRTWRFGRFASFNVRGATRGRYYSTGDTQLTVDGRAGLNVNLARPLTLTTTYTYREVWGDTPFRFDRVSPSETVSARLNWRTSALTASVNTSYNFRTERWGRLTGNATWRALPNMSLRATATYDLYRSSIQDVVGTVDWRPADDWRIRLGARYNVPTEQWRRVDADIEMSLGGGWKAGVTSIFDVARNSFSRHHMFLSHDADCREIKLRYDETKGEVWLEYHIAAFPSSRVAVGTGDDQLLFEADALDEFLGN